MIFSNLHSLIFNFDVANVEVRPLISLIMNKYTIWKVDVWKFYIAMNLTRFYMSRHKLQMIVKMSMWIIPKLQNG